MLGKIEGRRRRGWQRMRWLDDSINSMDLTLSKLWETVKDREAWRAAVHRITKSRTRLGNWKAIMVTCVSEFWCHPCNCFDMHDTGLHKTESLINVACALTAQLIGHSAISLLPSRPLDTLRYIKVEIRPSYNPTVASKCSSEGESHTSLTLSQKLVKDWAQRGRRVETWARWKAMPLEWASQWENAKEKLSREIESANAVNTNDEKIRQRSCWHGKSFSGLDRGSQRLLHSLKTKPSVEKALCCA